MPGNVVMRSSTESVWNFMLHQSMNSTIPDHEREACSKSLEARVYRSEHIEAIVLRFSSVRMETFHKSSEAF